MDWTVATATVVPIFIVIINCSSAKKPKEPPIVKIFYEFCNNKVILDVSFCLQQFVSLSFIGMKETKLKEKMIKT